MASDGFDDRWAWAVNRRRFLRMAGVGSLGLAAAALIGCGDDDDDDDDTDENIGTADVIGIWGGDELTAFDAMIAAWKADTGGDVAFVGTRDLTAQLTTRVEGGNPPDIAVPAEVGLFRQFAEEGQLVTLDDLGIEDLVKDKYPDGFIDLGTVDGDLYAFFMKADTKGTIWYNPKTFDANGLDPLDADSDFGDLLSLSEDAASAGLIPWSIGVESGGASGWPGTDWIQQILLNEAGGDTYDGVIDGSVAFTDGDVKDAWEKFGQIALTDGWTVQGGAEGINATGFQQSSFPPFEPGSNVAMVYLGGFASGFITEQFPNAVPGEDFDFMPFPGGGVTGGANVCYAFNDDATTRSLMAALAGAAAQQAWVDIGGFTSVNRDVSLDSYPNVIARKQAEQLTEAELFRFDLDDAIGGELQQAFFNGVTQYLANPGSLDEILENIEGARA